MYGNIKISSEDNEAINVFVDGLWISSLTEL